MKFHSVYVAAFLSTVAACGGGGGGTDNRSACLAYVETINALPCVTGATRQDPNTFCPASLDATGCDVSSYYDCLSDAVMCRDLGGMSVLDPSSTTRCTMTTCR